MITGRHVQSFTFIVLDGGSFKNERTLCVQLSVGSPNPAIHNARRASLLSSALFGPRRQSLEVVSEGVMKLSTTKL